MVNIINSKIEYIIKGKGGFLNLNHKLFAISFHEFSKDHEKRKFLLTRNKEFVNNAPGFDQDNRPFTNKNYKSLETYWGTTDTTGCKS